MKPSEKIDLRDVGALIQRLARQVTIPRRFSVEAAETEVANGIYAAMVNEVGLRGRELVFDDTVKAQMLHAARWLADSKGKPGLLFMGLYGNGKTTLMRAICRFTAWISEETEGYGRGLTPRHITAKRIAELCRENPSGKEYRSLFDEPALAIDDLGEEPGEVMSFGMLYTPLVDLLSVRYDRQLLTLATTNLTNSEIAEKYSGRIADRFNEMMEVVIFENESFRRKAV